MSFSIGFRLVASAFAVASICFPAVLQEIPSMANDHLRSTQQGLAAKPKVPLTPEMRGDIFMARKMYREAIDMYRQIEPPSPTVLNKIGIAFHEMLQFQLAKKYYELAIRRDPGYSEAINNVGTIFYEQHFYKKAIVYYKRSLRYSDPTAAVYVNIGAAYFARHDYKHASTYYEQALEMDPDVFEHRGGFGTIMQERTVEELANFHLYLAKTYAKRGSNERALMYLRKALEEGIKDRNKIPDIPEFTELKKDPGFQQLLAENPKPL
jgi:tetratricopeptide (TPR) repeat protein